MGGQVTYLVKVLVQCAPRQQEAVHQSNQESLARRGVIIGGCHLAQNTLVLHCCQWVGHALTPASHMSPRPI